MGGQRPSIIYDYKQMIYQNHRKEMYRKLNLVSIIIICCVLWSGQIEPIALSVHEFHVCLQSRSCRKPATLRAVALPLRHSQDDWTARKRCKRPITLICCVLIQALPSHSIHCWNANWLVNWLNTRKRYAGQDLSLSVTILFIKVRFISEILN